MTLISTCAVSAWLAVASAAGVPDEPLDIATDTQYFIDDYLVDNRYALAQHSKKLVVRRLHIPTKVGNQPVFADPDAPMSYLTVRHEAEAGLFKMWYQAWVSLYKPGEYPGTGPLFGCGHLRYAESNDGIHWTCPTLGLYELAGNKDNNICFANPDFGKRRTDGVSGMGFLNERDMPPSDRRGYKYIMTYNRNGGDNHIFVIGSRDGIHWDQEAQVPLMKSGSDGWCGMQYDPLRKKYVAWTRARDRYWVGKANSLNHQDFDRNDFVYQGIVRRVAQVENDVLWSSDWPYPPRMVIIPDEVDEAHHATALMDARIKFCSSAYLGFIMPFDPKTSIWSELILSRDGRSFERMRPAVLPTGGEGAWDAGQAWASDFVEVGDEWWIYTFGGSRPPNTPIYVEQTDQWGVGLAKIRKEGFVSLNVPDTGGLIVTRLVRWPGGDLLVNADPTEGEMRVRVSTDVRQTVEGFDFPDCRPITGDGVAHKVQWQNNSLDSLKGRIIRLEFYFSQAADLYTFRATGESRAPRQ